MHEIETYRAVARELRDEGFVAGREELSFLKQRRQYLYDKRNDAPLLFLHIADEAALAAYLRRPGVDDDTLRGAVDELEDICDAGAEPARGEGR